MLRSGAFWLGLGAGAVVTWFVRRQRGSMVQAGVYYPKPIRRQGRRGAGWTAGQGGGSYR